MNKPARFLKLTASPICAVSAFATALFCAGCTTDKLPRDLMAEEVNADTPSERPVAMRGETAFLDGKLGTVVTVSRGFARQDSGMTHAKGGHEVRARKHREDDIDEDIGYGETEEDQKRAFETYMRQLKAHRAAGSPMPPVTLRVQLENRGTEPLEIEVTDVNSYLGNFAVRPSKLTIAPGEKGTLEPMISQLGVTSDEIPLQLAVRVKGKKEAQTVTVKNILAPTVGK